MVSAPSIVSADTLGVPRWLAYRLLTVVTTLTAHGHLDKFSAIGVNPHG
jgi:hypothetical protein